MCENQLLVPECFVVTDGAIDILSASFLFEPTESGFVTMPTGRRRSGMLVFDHLGRECCFLHDRGRNAFTFQSVIRLLFAANFPGPLSC